MIERPKFFRGLMFVTLAWTFVLACGYKLVHGCPTDSVAYAGGCAALPVPADQGVAVVPSDERPPSEKMPSYQREGIHADMPSVSNEDEDKAKAEADGKKAAGL